jgi:hypothetical protein
MAKVRDVTSPQEFDAAVASGSAVRILDDMPQLLRPVGTSSQMQIVANAIR